MSDHYAKPVEVTQARARQAKYRRRIRLAMSLLHAAESRGLSGTEALALIQHADYWTRQECQQRYFHPEEFE